MVAEVLEKKRLYSIQEYFELEKKALFKSEFRNGKIIKMPGGSYAHNRIMQNISSTLEFLIKDEYEVVNSEHAIYIPTHNHTVFSDTCVIKGEPEFYKGGSQAILNPALIFEVASNSTFKYDRVGKFRKYKTIPSFEEYVLIDQEVPVVDVFYKKGGIWTANTYVGLEETVVLNSIDCELKMTAIYKKIKGLLNPQSVLDL